MFMNLLNDDQKAAFATLAEMMITSDGIVVGREAATLGALKGEMGLTDDAAATGSSVADLATAFTDRRAKMVALLELVGLGYSDTSFSGTERSLVSEVARAMDVAGDDLDVQPGQALQGFAHLGEGHHVVSCRHGLADELRGEQLLHVQSDRAGVEAGDLEQVLDEALEADDVARQEVERGLRPFGELVSAGLHHLDRGGTEYDTIAEVPGVDEQAIDLRVATDIRHPGR